MEGGIVVGAGWACLAGLLVELRLTCWVGVVVRVE